MISRSLYRSLALLAAAVCLAAPAAAPAEEGFLPPREYALRTLALRGGATLAHGGFALQVPGLESGAPVAAATEPAPLLRRRLEGRGPAPRGAFDAMAVGRGRLFDPRPGSGGDGGVARGVGDTLVVSLDDGFEAPFEETWEATLRPSFGAAGADDWASIRFPLRSLAVGPPLEVNEILLGVDNLGGAGVWPAIELRLEDAARPLEPRAGPVCVVTDFDTRPLLAALPAGATRPTDFQRVPVGMPPLQVGDTWLSDGGNDDDFDRTSEPLDNPASDWLECRDADCDAAGDLQVLEPGSPECAALSGGCVRRLTGGADTLAVKFQSFDVFLVRSALDLEQRASVALDLSDPGADRAGLALRVSAADTYYRVEYVRSSDVVEVTAVVQGAENLVGSSPVPAPQQSDTPVLEVEVTGTAPSIDFRIRVDGVELAPMSDPTWLLSGTLVGIASGDNGGSGEMWDDFRLERRPDLFANVQFPEGGWEALPLDVSNDAVISSSILTSLDGSSFTPRWAGTGCVNPGNPLVQLEVHDHLEGDRLFEREANVVSVRVGCPGCPTGRNGCVENRSADERLQPVFVEGETLSVTVGWWNEHLGDLADFTFRTSVFDRGCGALDSGAVLVDQADTVVTDTPGQRGSGPLLLEASVLDFTAFVAGDYCVVVEEILAGGDSNPVPALVLRDLTVELPCTPAAASNLDGRSLRVARAAGDPLATDLTWDVVDPGIFPATYNVQMMPAEPFTGAGFEEFAPIYARVVGELSRTLDVPAPPDGRPLWIAVYETDGCPSGNSILP